MHSVYNVTIINSQFGDHFFKQNNLQEIFLYTNIKASTDVNILIVLEKKWGGGWG